MRRIYLKIAILTLVVLTIFTVPLLLDRAANLIHVGAPSGGQLPIVVASPITVQSHTTSPSTDATRATSAVSVGTPAPESVEFTAQDAAAYVAANSPFISDPSQPPPTVTIEYLTRAEVEARLNTQVVVPNNVPLCLVTLRGHFIDNTFSRPDGVGPQPGMHGYLLFDAHTGSLILEGGSRD